MFRPRGLSDNRQEACIRLAQQTARETGQVFVGIRYALMRIKLYDYERRELTFTSGRRITIGRDEYCRTVIDPDTGCELQKPADMHLTLDLGKHLYDVRLQGHVFVKCERGKIPTSIMTPEDRKIIHKGDPGGGLQLWGYGGSLGYDYVALPPLDDTDEGKKSSCR
jgi:hypothetical protein